MNNEEKIFKQRIEAYLASSRRNGAAWLGMKDTVNAIVEEERAKVGSVTQQEKKILAYLNAAQEEFDKMLAADTATSDSGKEAQRRSFEFAVVNAQHTILARFGLRSVNKS